ncbi:MAG: glycosyltransferase family 39 protein [Candidatus Doudnabacteria bacterium]
MHTKSKITIVLFLLILILAGIFRFWQIRDLPGGLYSDEGANGLDVLDILSGKNRDVFYERNYGREGLFFYLLALSVKIFGIGVWQMKIVSGILGILTIIGLYLLTKTLFNRTIALLASLFAAVSIPYTFLSRVAFRANMLPFVSVFLFYFCVKTLKDKKDEYFYSFLAGIFLALGFYTYISFRIVPFCIIALIILFEIISRRTGNPKGFIVPHRKQIFTALIAFLIAIAPLAFYFYQHPSSFFGRANDVSILNPNLAHGPFYYLLRNIGITAIMFNVYGDANWRHNLSEAPFFDPVTGVLFLVGLIIAATIFLKTGLKVLKHKDIALRETFAGYLLIFGWFFSLLVPMMATEEAIPHFLRSIGIIPVVFIFPALGLRALFLRIRYRPVMLGFLLLLSVVFVVNYNLWLYFQVAKNAYGYYTSYYGDLTLASRYINEINASNAKFPTINSANTFLVLDDKADRTVRFLTAPANPYILIPINAEIKTTYPESARIIFPSLSFNRLASFQNIFPEARLIYEEYNRFGEKAFEVYTIIFNSKF